MKKMLFTIPALVAACVLVPTMAHAGPGSNNAYGRAFDGFCPSPTDPTVVATTYTVSEHGRQWAFPDSQDPTLTDQRVIAEATVSSPTQTLHIHEQFTVSPVGPGGPGRYTGRVVLETISGDGSLWLVIGSQVVPNDGYWSPDPSNVNVDLCALLVQTKQQHVNGGTAMGGPA